MSWESIQSKWEQVKGEVRSKWGKLTDDDIAECKGNREKLVGKVMERYDVDKEEAERQVSTWSTTVRPSSN
jgi:uncharacterized protein YjbJ (UPF0337 family)